ncbi:unannotated protein [freshwater metagenome]|uniref:Unannotated protein n=1 Tax=freshwater metagenome TaxID=449393 RepID=A0A6J6TDZ2_9ZZZZ
MDKSSASGAYEFSKFVTTLSFLIFFLLVAIENSQTKITNVRAPVISASDRADITLNPHCHYGTNPEPPGGD